MTKELRQAYDKLTIDTLENYKLYQLENDRNIKNGDHTLYWFTIKPISPRGRWDRFQLDLKKYVCPFYYDLCERLNGKHWNKKNRKHLKPFLFAAPDYENSNNQGPLIVNDFNHVQGLICIRNDQKHILNNLLRKHNNNYTYVYKFDKVREITIAEANHTTMDNIGYKIYLNKNSNRKYDNINNFIYLPFDQKFIKSIKTRKQSVAAIAKHGNKLSSNHLGIDW
ncbi:hypothetical protein K1X45_11025 [Pseudochrobactrum sp. Wa41.01b-1]|uniref:hypothetical protein n=1 Tax=Pseudochrobactrum sp. Wa41.01b-1 TaxID=2864102 RepID=UPI001C689F65|nr:hypothetical protein [Pseudochrobactrum sp. Wa41.01b-1]QYM72037.1 hypothetical protein K1X45_11025 [Pseudochrobactrum sp. Wa41.01b-1]